MTPDEILKGLYDETMVGNKPAVLELTQAGIDSGLPPERMLFEALIPSLEEVGARFERGDWFAHATVDARSGISVSHRSGIAVAVGVTPARAAHLLKELQAMPPLPVSDETARSMVNRLITCPPVLKEWIDALKEIANGH